NPVVKKQTFKEAYRLAGHPLPRVGTDTPGFYEYAVAFLDGLETAVRAAGGRIRDRLDAQGAVWVLAKWENPPADWSDEDKLRFLQFRTNSRATELDEEDENGQPDEPPDDDLENLARDLFIDKDELKEMAAVIVEKRQAVFYG